MEFPALSASPSPPLPSPPPFPFLSNSPLPLPPSCTGNSDGMYIHFQGRVWNWSLRHAAPVDPRREAAVHQRPVQLVEFVPRGRGHGHKPLSRGKGDRGTHVELRRQPLRLRSFWKGQHVAFIRKGRTLSSLAWKEPKLGWIATSLPLPSPPSFPPPSPISRPSIPLQPPSLQRTKAATLDPLSRFSPPHPSLAAISPGAMYTPSPLSPHSHCPTNYRKDYLSQRFVRVLRIW